MQYLSFIFFALAAASNGVMDTLLWHFKDSVFKNLDIYWWNPLYSWMKVKNFLGIVRIDGWHIAKYGWLGFTILAIVFYQPIFGWWTPLVYPIIWFIGFEIPYNLLYKKPKQ